MFDRPTHPGRELLTASLVTLVGLSGLVSTLRRMRRSKRLSAQLLAGQQQARRHDPSTGHAA